jgi:predicted small metal-binding protein
VPARRWASSLAPASAGWAVRQGCGAAYDVAVKQIDCVCGYVVKGEDDDELWEKAQEHLRSDHPDLVDKVSREDILAQAEEL